MLTLVFVVALLVGLYRSTLAYKSHRKSLSFPFATKLDSAKFALRFGFTNFKTFNPK